VPVRNLGLDGCHPEQPLRPSVGNYGPKRDFLKTYGSKLFTCGFNDTEIEKQANNSICCQVKLSPETEDK